MISGSNRRLVAGSAQRGGDRELNSGVPPAKTLLETGKNHSVSAGSMAPGARRPRRERLVAKEFRSAEQLSAMIVSALGISEITIRVREDHAYGWQPTVVSCPGDSIGYQRRVEEIANRLRLQFNLKE
jgi:hypothetical protein